MKKNKNTYLIVLLACCLSVLNIVQLNAQDAYKKFDQETYDDLTKDVDYEEDILEREEKERQPKNHNPIDFGDWSLMGDLFKGGLIALVVLGLGYIAFRIFDENYTDRKIINYKDKNLIENLEQHIHEVDLQDFLQKALKQGNFKLAVRIYYLIIIKDLSNSNLINWKKQKTNGEYLSEMYGKPLFESFRRSTNHFERVWYGDIEIDQSKYNTIVKDFDVLLNKIPKPTGNETK